MSLLIFYKFILFVFFFFFLYSSNKEAFKLAFISILDCCIRCILTVFFLPSVCERKKFRSGIANTVVVIYGFERVGKDECFSKKFYLLFLFKFSSVGLNR